MAALAAAAAAVAVAVVSDKPILHLKPVISFYASVYI